ncbi:hypothetical protein EMIHUDRAFT_95980 [Emiliania huxleyi CCMP1516]|uniref:Calpain catalytic domain-containing protein n=3 Tax=Emiliania huxleyi TaxID=2903 RepID=A0A0D3J3W2_EMIH1|nr:hypothetical protein EMIHUDRAFT_95980 [Emiliania huxleyi CCMP1516]EOD18197.1 hypothetical protein EMIHUDRAFT_95980 [Emiliania huxleyi CCMP1516]|eukprot:XP_005770626.1 hypothetical protein EMIHUDRAFT_95980 [Emiliania huxleyi CCMP1516]
MAASLADGLLLGDDSDVECADAATRESLWRPPTQPPLRLGFPDGWPDSFRSCPPLKRLLGGSHLRGSRCRAVEPPSAAELTAAAAAGVVPLPLRSFANATRLAEASVGTSVVRGFCVFERLRDEPSGAERIFVGVRHWWNADATGRWVDITPPLVASARRSLLVESPLGVKSGSPPTPATRAASAALARVLAAAAGGEAAAHDTGAASPSSPSAAASLGPAAAGGGGGDGGALAAQGLPDAAGEEHGVSAGGGPGAAPADAAHTAQAASLTSAGAEAGATARRLAEESGAPPAAVAAAAAAAEAAVSLGAKMDAAMAVASAEALRASQGAPTPEEAAAAAAAAVRKAASGHAGRMAAGAARRAGAPQAAIGAAEEAAAAAICSGKTHAEAAAAADEAARLAAEAEAAAAGQETAAAIREQEEAAGRAAAVADAAAQVRRQGMMALRAEDLSALGAKVEKEEEAVRAHQDEVRRAAERLAAGCGDALDQATVDELPPAAPTADMMREAMGGRDATRAEAGVAEEARWAEAGVAEEAAAEAKRRVARAEVCRFRGNESFVEAGRVQGSADARAMLCEALEQYEAGIAELRHPPAARCSPSLLATLHANAAAVHLRLGAWEAARASASAGLRFAPSHVKLRVRRAEASGRLGCHRSACDDLWAAVRSAGSAAAKSTAVASLVRAWAGRAPRAAAFVHGALAVDGSRGRGEGGGEGGVGCDGDVGEGDNGDGGAKAGRSASASAEAAGVVSLALCRALHADGRSREWAHGGESAESEARAAVSTRPLLVAGAGSLAAASLPLADGGDGGGAAALLRLAAWLCACPAADAAEAALIVALAAPADDGGWAGEGGDASELAAPAQPPSLLEALTRDGGCSEAAASGWMVTVPRDSLGPLLARAASLHKATRVLGPWALDEEAAEGRTIAAQETGVCLGDGGD